MPSFDVAIMDALKGPNAWSLPAITEAFRLEQDTPEQVEATLLARIESAEEQLKEWIANAGRIRAAMEEVSRSAKAASVALDLATLQRLTDFVSQQITLEEKERAGYERTLKEAFNFLGRLSTSYKPALRRASKRIRAMMDRRHDALVDLYYALLAVHADHDPDAQGGPAFDNDDDLIAYLQS